MTYIKQLSHMLNLSLLEGILPGELTIARITPIFKDSNDKEQSNCRQYQFYRFLIEFWKELCITDFLIICLKVIRISKKIFC